MSAPRAYDGIRLVATRPAINCACLFVVSTLTKWGARSILLDAVKVTEELVTGAVEATCVMEDRPHLTDPKHLNFVTVRLLALEASVVIEVWDCEPDSPTQPPPTGSVVKHGSYLTDGGKVVWAELPVYPHRSSTTRDG